MNIEFTPNEARVIGCLIEKEITTPDQYPLSLNALTNACNQKTNRDPVLELSEAGVQQAVDSLMKKYMVSDKSAGYGGRVTKYKHRFCNTEFGSLKFSKQELGIICVMLLRGAQTPGELRARTNRLCEFADADQVEDTLKNLIARPDGPFIARLPRAAGARESRYAHLFSGNIESVEEAAAPEEPAAVATLSQRVSQLEESLRAMRIEVDALVQRLNGGSRTRPCYGGIAAADAVCLAIPSRSCIHLSNAVDIRGAHSVCRGTVTLNPLLHRQHQLIRQRTCVIEQVHVRGLRIVQAIDGHIGLAAMFDRFEKIRLERERMVVVVDRLVVGAQAQMHEAGVIPSIDHVALVAQRLRELIQRFAIGIADLFHRAGLLVRIRRLGGHLFEFPRAVQ